MRATLLPFLGTLSLVAFSAPASAQVIHVDDSAVGANDGSSWQDAFTDLQSALAVASFEHVIWVARGTYKPSSTLDRFASFQVACDVYGGFDGTETDFADRAGLFDETILTGDLLGDDGPDFADNAENSVHVVSFGFNVDAVLDGFTVRGGNSDQGPYSDGGGLDVDFYANSGVVRNCTFTSNWAQRQGGGIGCGGLAFLQVERCTFIGNHAAQGGGMAGGSSTSVKSCRFLGNTADGAGGGLLFAVLAADCLFSGNTAGGSGGGVSQTEELWNCTFSRNTASLGGGAFGHSSNTIELRNCVLWQNADDTGQVLSGQVAGAVVVYSAIVQGWDPSLGWPWTFDADPRFRWPLGPDGVAGTLDDDLRLEPGSPCVDTGRALGYAGLGTDAIGRPRFVDSLDCDSGDVIDRGALERAHIDETTTFCESSPSTLGVPAVVSTVCRFDLSDGPTLVFAGPIPVPDGNSFLLLGRAGAPQAFGDGYLCLTGPLGRIAAVAYSFQTVTYVLDPSVPPASEMLHPGATIGLQALFRDVATGRAGFNFSSAMRLLVVP